MRKIRAAMANEMDNEEQYICVGICMADPDSGYCQGCGRPPLDSPDVVVEIVVPAPKPANNDQDNPE